MTELERYLFDLQGFLVLENALSSAQIAAINQVLDKQIAKVDQPFKPWVRFDGLLNWGTEFRNLIDNPRITPYLEALLGSRFRLDHDYVHILRQGSSGPIGSILHGGGTPYDPCQYYLYKEGKIFNGLVAVAYNLTDVPAGSGGFGCIPGSHKSNLPLPQEWQDLENPHPCVQKVSGKAGTAIIFTEALSHGTLPWKGQHERRTLFYKYSPYASAWARYYYNPDDYPDLTQNQRQILKTPGFYP
ncbi:phytanoyl-CoA dioxygenase family protein [Aetokthonos hydrillicola Thurmond2011]|uniref:Phytanoyl-CoA dioxygenase family protein n=1 Tax=Aetokthonos hydrillicola Thurmond2011 TaxID=2712845 RepID=A0AAP5MCQ8_9CYAN|nr:phytanoyl-CoA dioxygenase family protein [Aetokthonos hydrillicola]MBO3457150.1 phytanoyl-CoA dioxygenase family protein [Aetokthonos hydrillicola CCALA 1050]MBW4587497.1 phytanoyl-CoA dioxygenase family protein [Aetokthonos hydrillicola CCALA 1050]MDR9898638.1 phytanoyl-CoA dioxygenase family protein [Aetokthonos hydrillicola Thurmond2011]